MMDYPEDRRRVNMYHDNLILGQQFHNRKTAGLMPWAFLQMDLAQSEASLMSALLLISSCCVAYFDSDYRFCQEWPDQANAP
jgi:hypothetical protein